MISECCWTVVVSLSCHCVMSVYFAHNYLLRPSSPTFKVGPRAVGDRRQASRHATSKHDSDRTRRSGRSTRIPTPDRQPPTAISLLSTAFSSRLVLLYVTFPLRSPSSSLIGTLLSFAVDLPLLRHRLSRTLRKLSLEPCPNEGCPTIMTVSTPHRHDLLMGA